MTPIIIVVRNKLCLRIGSDVYWLKASSLYRQDGLRGVLVNPSYAPKIQ